MVKDNIEVIARAVIVKNGRILLCQAKGKGHWFLPGGHLERGEDLIGALKREIMEETGAEIAKIEFIGINESSYSESAFSHQEVNIIFSAEIADDAIVSKEGHLKYDWIDISELESVIVKPESLKLSVIFWIKNKEKFYSK